MASESLKIKMVTFKNMIITVTEYKKTNGEIFTDMIMMGIE